MKRMLPAALALLFASACGSMEYRDTTAAVNANPLCVGEPDHPNAPVAQDCERKQEASWSSERESRPVDFSGKDDDR